MKGAKDIGQAHRAAGEAVAAFLLGREIVRVTTRPNEHGLPSCTVRPRPGLAIDDALIRLAGLVAEAERDAVAVELGDEDTAYVVKIAEPLVAMFPRNVGARPESVLAHVAYLVERARDLVTVPPGSALVRVLADELASRETLTGPGVEGRLRELVLGEMPSDREGRQVATPEELDESAECKSDEVAD